MEKIDKFKNSSDKKYLKSDLKLMHERRLTSMARYGEYLRDQSIKRVPLKLLILHKLFIFFRWFSLGLILIVLEHNPVA